MAEMTRVILDAGHGGAEPGATYSGRQEKTDTLNLTLKVGRLLAEKGIDVVYTRVDDTYQSPYEKAEIANRSGADYFVSIHRNAMPVPGTASGSQVLVYEKNGAARQMAEDINRNLQKAGFADLGIIERPGLVVLRETEMSAVLVEAGFIDNEADNRLFDQNIDGIARAIADGIDTAIQDEKAGPYYYQVQTGAYRDAEPARQQVNRLISQGFPAFLVYKDSYYKVRTGAFLHMEYAVQMEKRLRDYGYNTFLVREREWTGKGI